MEAMLVALRSFGPVDADRPVGQLDAVDGDGLADARGLAEFPGDAPHGRGRDRGDLLGLLGRVSGDMLAQQIERRAALFSLRLVGSGQGRIAQAGVVMELGGAIGGIVDQRLLCLVVAQIAPVGADQIGRVGLVLQERLVVDFQIVQQHMQHAERQRGVGSGADRNPLVGFARGVAADRIDDDELHAACTGVGHVARDVVVGAARGDAHLGADQNAIFGVMQVGLLMKSAAGKILDRMYDLAAGRRTVVGEVRRAEGGGEGLEPVDRVADRLPSLNP